MKKLSIALLLSMFVVAPLTAVVGDIGGTPTEANTGASGAIAEGVGLLTPTPDTGDSDGMATLTAAKAKRTPQEAYDRYMQRMPKLASKLALAANDPARLAQLQAKLAKIQAKWVPRIAEWQKQGILPADDTSMETLTAAQPASDTAPMDDIAPAEPNA